MRFSVSRALVGVGFSALFALTAACGGSKPEAKAPETEAANSASVGSPDPVPVADGPTPDLPKSIAADNSTANGSEIIPPFSGSKDTPAAPATGKKAPGKGGKKTAAKPKKKG